MTKGFYNFIVHYFTIPILVSVIVFKIFTIILDNLISPLLFVIVDNNNILPNMKMTYGQHTCDYGKAFRDIFASFLTLLIIYLLI